MVAFGDKKGLGVMGDDIYVLVSFAFGLEGNGLEILGQPAFTAEEWALTGSEVFDTGLSRSSSDKTRGSTAEPSAVEIGALNGGRPVVPRHLEGRDPDVALVSKDRDAGVLVALPGLSKVAVCLPDKCRGAELGVAVRGAVG